MATAELLRGGSGEFGAAGNWTDRPLAPYDLAFQPSAYQDVSWLLAQFTPISLAETNDIALLDRTDTKYVLSVRQLCAALAGLPEHYRVLSIEGTQMHRYRTLYFDTDDLALYRQHHSEKPFRCKVRSREYVDTGQAYLEVKWKTKRDRTEKTRTRTLHFVEQWAADASDLPCARALPAAQSLGPRVLNVFYRITLVGKHYKERVTLDLGLQFSGNGRTVTLPGVAIAEVKQDGVNRHSDFVRQMRAAGIRPGGFSKYCVGVAMLYQDVKHNSFKSTLRLISELMRGDGDV